MHSDCCVEVAANWYSAPQALIRQRVSVLVRDQQVLIGHGGRLVAEHIGALVKGQQQGTLEVRLAQYAKPKLLINRCAEGCAYDELGYLPLEPQAGHLFFQLISRRYEQGSVLISSNRPVQEWDEVYSFGEGFAYGDQVVAAAILDRLMHHSHVVMIRGDSYRLREKRRAGLRRNSRNSPTGINDGRKPTQPATETMSKQRYRQRSQDGTTPTTRP